MRRFLFLDPSAELPVKCVGTKGIDLSRKESRGEDSVDHGPDLSKTRIQRQPASPPPAPPAKREKPNEVSPREPTPERRLRHSSPSLIPMDSPVSENGGDVERIEDGWTALPAGSVDGGLVASAHEVSASAREAALRLGHYHSLLRDLASVSPPVAAPFPLDLARLSPAELRSALAAVQKELTGVRRYGQILQDIREHIGSASDAATPVAGPRPTTASAALAATRAALLGSQELLAAAQRLAQAEQEFAAAAAAMKAAPRAAMADATVQAQLFLATSVQALRPGVDAGRVSTLEHRRDALQARIREAEKVPGEELVTRTFSRAGILKQGSLTLCFQSMASLRATCAKNRSGK